MPVQYCRNEKVEAAPMEKETLLFYPETKKFCRLNETAAFLWQVLDSAQTVEQLVDAVCAEFDGVGRGQAASDVENTVKEMLQQSLIIEDTSDEGSK